MIAWVCDSCYRELLKNVSFEEYAIGGIGSCPCKVCNKITSMQEMHPVDWDAFVARTNIKNNIYQTVKENE